MGKISFIIGGARSGKSKYAQKLAMAISKKVAFIATCIPQDEEMKKRIILHKKSRPSCWKTIEDPDNIKAALSKLKSRYDVIIIDCLGLLISKFLSDGFNEKKIEKEVKAIVQALTKARYAAIIVSNEVGSGIVPANALARRFVDILGVSNQTMSQAADTVYAMHAGIPIKIKGGGNEHT